MLSDERGGVRWISVWEGLGILTPDLRLPLAWNGDSQGRDEVKARSVLGSVAGRAFYSPFLDWASASGRVFHAFAYDWRRDNLETVGQFTTFLEKFSAENGGRRVQVVAHSMGGLIAFIALTRRPDLFHSVLFAGVPFSGSVSFLRDMHAGTSTGFNKRILSPQVLFTFTSPYVLFPGDPNDSGLSHPSGEPITHDWFSVADWTRQKLGIFANASGNGSTRNGSMTAAREHLSRALARALEFRRLLVSSDSVSYPPIAVLAGNSLATMKTVICKGPHAVKGWDFVTAPKQAGDDRVYFEGAMPPQGVPYRLFTSPRHHGDLLNDAKQVESILAQLSGL